MAFKGEGKIFHATCVLQDLCSDILRLHEEFLKAVGTCNVTNEGQQILRCKNTAKDSKDGQEWRRLTQIENNKPDLIPFGEVHRVNPKKSVGKNRQ